MRLLQLVRLISPCLDSVSRQCKFKEQCVHHSQQYGVVAGSKQIAIHYSFKMLVLKFKQRGISKLKQFVPNM